MGEFLIKFVNSKNNLVNSIIPINKHMSKTYYNVLEMKWNYMELY